MASLLKSTGIVAVSTLCSRFLGLFRDILMASYFGAARTADVFYIAFMIPNLFRRLVAEGALTISFVPVYTESLHREGRKGALDLAQKTMTVQCLAVVFIIAAGMFFSPEIMTLFFKRFDSVETFGLSVNLTRFMFPYLFFAAFVAFAMGYLNSHGHFFAPAFAPVLLNVGIISGILVFSRFFETPIYGAAAGVLLGGFMQMLLQFPYMIRHGYKFRISVDFRHEGIRKIFRMLVPALFGIAVYQINILVNNMLATMLPEGSVTYIYFTNRLTELVLGVFIVSIGSVILPEMSRLRVGERTEEFRKLFSDSLCSALFLAIPAATALFVVGLEILSVFFMRGNFTFSDTVNTYHALMAASIGVVFVSVLRITTQAYYSMKDTRTPVISAAVSLFVNITLGYILMHTSLKHAGLTLANSISSLVQMGILLVMVQKKAGGLDMKRIFSSVIRFIFASIVMGVVIWKLASFADWERDTFLYRTSILGIIVGAGGSLYFIVNIMTGTREMIFLVNKFKAVLRRVSGK